MTFLCVCVSVFVVDVVCTGMCVYLCVCVTSVMLVLQCVSTDDQACVCDAIWYSPRFRLRCDHPHRCSYDSRLDISRFTVASALSACLLCLRVDGRHVCAHCTGYLAHRKSCCCWWRRHESALVCAQCGWITHRHCRVPRCW